MEPIFFETPAALRQWLKKHHNKSKELIVGYYKVGSGKRSISWSASVDEALCYGWIDGVRTSIDKDSYMIRFTARKPGSIWSAVNIKKVEAFIKEGKMHTAGLEAYNKRQAKKSAIYAHEKNEAVFTPSQQKLLQSNKSAWKYFQSLAASYQKLSAHWVNSAKQSTTKEKRMQQIIEDAANGTNQWKDNKYKK
jgi:uncharacterized protein YdeI (YjbR/CyaY-like superfamily)